MLRLTFATAFVACLFVGASDCHAQRATTTTGTFGGRTLGGGVGGSSQSIRNQGLSQTGQINSDAAIQRQAGSFVGADAGDVTNIRSLSGGANNRLGGLGGFNTGLGGLGGFGGGLGGIGGFGINSQFGRQGLNQGNQTGNTTNSNRTLRTPLRIGFTPAKGATTTRVTARLAKRLTKIPQLSIRSGMVDVKMEGRTAVLSGTVASDHQRRLAARLALFEPGVSDVRNELKVDPSVAPPEKDPAPEQLPLPGSR